MSVSKPVRISSRISIWKIILSARMGLLLGLILSLMDLYLGVLFAEMSLPSYIGFFAAYLVMCVVLCFVVHVVLNILSKSENVETYYNGICFACLLFLCDFVYANMKFCGWFDLTNLRAIVINLLLVLNTAVLIGSIYKVKKIRGHFSDIYGFLQMAVLAFGFTAFFNYFVLNFPLPPPSKTKVVALLFVLMAIPYLVFVVKSGCDALFSAFTKSAFKVRFSGIGFAVLLVLIIPLIIKYPDLSSYETTAYEPNKSQLNDLKNKPNIIWLVLDTVRRDHLSCYGYDRQTTPNIDKFSKEAVLFTNYFSSAPWTLPTHSSMFTGTYSSKHGAHNADLGLRKANPLSDENTTLAEILKDYGFKTGGISANNGALSIENNLDQGFDFYIANRPQVFYFFWGLVSTGILPQAKNIKFLKLNFSKLSSAINKLVYRWLDKNASSPFFLFINYMEAHSGVKYLPEPYDSKFGRDALDRYQRMLATIDQKAIANNRVDITPKQRQDWLDWKDCKMAYMDHNFGQLFKKLKELNLYDNSMIIVVSDHGQLFGEHNAFGHVANLYTELIHVPLIIKYPKEENSPGVVNSKYVQAVDLMPEVLSVLEIPLPEGIQGQPIDQMDHDVIAEWFRREDDVITELNYERFYRDLKAIITYKGEKFKYIHSSNGNSELYDLSEDQDEQHNLIAEMPSKMEEMDQRLADWAESFEPFKMPDKILKQISKEAQDRLRALGYIK